MKRAIAVVATCLGLAVGAVGVTPAPASAAGYFSFGFGVGPGPYGYTHPRRYPYYGPMYRSYPRQVCHPEVRLRKYVRHHRVHYRRVVVNVCYWSRY
jgi:hypothetical protein